MILSLKSSCILAGAASFILTQTPVISSWSVQKDNDYVPENRGPCANTPYSPAYIVSTVVAVEAGLYLYLMAYGPRVGVAHRMSRPLLKSIAQLGTLETWHVVAASASIMGTSLRYWSIFTLDRFFTYQLLIRPEHKLIGTGPYTYLRHPSYTGYIFCIGPSFLLLLRKGLWDVLVAYLAQSSFYPLKALASRPSFLGISSGTIATVGFWCYVTHLMVLRIKYEEAMLSEHFGKEWDEYASKRWRLIPFLY
ncbi:hypothetical protein B0O80DRAFT_503050 [Mortierella sp. GBAus27b]|nr:hypothetical protein BGX31_006480 [Mortierella sp. GBA43]KAI8346926.1 hypothetical protein B0O80DRAFT_503050 [Mortierella sp. GBAus27b]